MKEFDKHEFGRLSQYKQKETQEYCAQEQLNFSTSHQPFNRRLVILRTNNINFIDGDEDVIKYEYGVNSMVNDRARVYKGGSWKDRAYWMSPGTRRFLDQEQRTDDIGFRCAMARVGSPVGMGAKTKK